MKRVLPILLAASLILLVAVSFAISTPTFFVSEAQGGAGEEVTLSIQTASNPGVIGISLQVHYDQTILELKSTAEKDFAGLSYSALDKQPFIVTWEDALRPNNTTNGTIVELTFVIKDTAPDGKTVVSVSYDEENVFNSDFDNVYFAKVSGGVTVHTHTYESVVTLPTCTEQGYTTHTCSHCSDSYVDTYVAALGHDLIHHDAKAATCTEIGWNAHDTCSKCDYTTYVEIPATGHDLIHHDAKAATCTAVGWNAYDTCSKCDYTTYVEIPATGHDLIHHDAKAATCTEIGWEAYDTCSRCDYTTYAAIPATGHSYNAVVTNPICTERGYTTYTCTGCGDSYVDSYVAALGHNWNAGVITTAPTCTQKGVKTFTCTRCTATKTEDVAALGHNLVHHDAKAATCTEIGWEAYDTCTRCDYTTYVELPVVVKTVFTTLGVSGLKSAKLLGGSEVQYYEVSAIEGTEVKTLKVVKDVYDDIKADTFTLGDYTVNKDGFVTSISKANDAFIGVEATNKLGYSNGVLNIGDRAFAQDNVLVFLYDADAEEFASQKISKNMADDIQPGLFFYYTDPFSDNTRTVFAIFGQYKETHTHSYSNAVTAPTCTERGYTTHTCACGDSYVDSYVAALGHNWNAGVITTAPTCTAKGVKTFTCTRCSATKTEDVAALGHDLVHHDAKAATCTEIGWEAYDTCSRCDYTTYVEIPATGHSYNAVVTNPTCTERGYTTHTCACGDSYVDSYVAATGHVYDDDQDAICNVCGYERAVTPPDPNAPQIVAESKRVRVGETFTVNVSLVNNPGIVSAEFTVDYDDTRLELVDIQAGEFGGTFDWTAGYPVTWYSTTPNVDTISDGVIAVLTFRAKDMEEMMSVATVGINYAADDIYNAGEKNVSFVKTSGEITIIQYLPGDINGDGILNNKDVTRLMRYVKYKDVEVVELALDVTGDGVVNNKDVTRLMRYVKYKDVEIH